MSTFKIITWNAPHEATAPDHATYWELIEVHASGAENCDPEALSEAWAAQKRVEESRMASPAPPRAVAPDPAPALPNTLAAAGWTLHYEECPGCFYWSCQFKKFIIYATPFWEDDTIPVQVMSCDGDHIPESTLNCVLPVTGLTREFWRSEWHKKRDMSHPEISRYGAIMADVLTRASQPHLSEIVRLTPEQKLNLYDLVYNKCKTVVWCDGLDLLKKLS